MTDNYDLDPHEHPETHADEGHGESKAEAWPDDQPPADGYEDPSAEEIATSSEETGGSPQEDVMDAGPRKSSPMMPIAAGVGGLLLVGAVLYWQFGRTPSPPVAAVTAPPPLQMTQPASPPPASVAAAPVIPISPTNGPNTLIPSAPANPANDVAPKTAMTPSIDNPTVAMPASSAPAAVTTAPTSSGIVASTPVPIESSAPPTSFPAPAVSAPPSAPIVAGESADARLNNLAARIDAMKTELDQINISMASPSSGAAGVEDRLTRIEQQLKQVEHTASAPSTMVNASSNDTSDITAAVPVTKPSHRESHSKSSHGHASHKSSTKPTTQAAKRGWVLRAATPSEAWIAKDEESADLRRVRVGDKLSGIGRVSAIRQVGDNWVVEGTAGMIR